jgi:hypothetical protein
VAEVVVIALVLEELEVLVAVEVAVQDALVQVVQEIRLLFHLL